MQGNTLESLQTKRRTVHPTALPRTEFTRTTPLPPLKKKRKKRHAALPCKRVARQSEGAENAQHQHAHTDAHAAISSTHLGFFGCNKTRQVVIASVADEREGIESYISTPRVSTTCARQRCLSPGQKTHCTTVERIAVVTSGYRPARVRVCVYDEEQCNQGFCQG